MKSRYLIYTAAAFFAIGAGVAWFFVSFRSGTFKDAPDLSSSSSQVRIDSSQYRFINPLLYSDNPEDDSPSSVRLDAALSSSIAGSEKDGTVTAVSVYFRDLNSGRWTGTDEDDLYAPSSMLKVVAMMAVLKLAEQNGPAILSDQLYYKPSSRAGQYYKPENDMKEGYYSIKDLMNAMITYSDNDALDAILSDQKIDQEFSDIYALFRLPPASASSTPDFMSPKSYAVLFRALYNSTFFQWDLSEQILGLLSETTFTQGLVAGVPQGTLVSHKFGENTHMMADGTIVDHELHDCGIVYYPQHPYLLCVMTRGSAFPSLEKAISGVSRTVWNAVDAQYSAGQ